MSIKYKNSQDNFITVQQAKILDEYKKAYFDSNLLIKEEDFFEGELKGAYIYNYNGENHSNIINNNQGLGYKWINIVEIISYTNGYRLRRSYAYGVDGTYAGVNLTLYDANNEEIAYGHKDTNGNYEYDLTRKNYYDRNINPDNDLFECTYKDNGDLWELYWNNEHINNSGQDSFVLWNTPEDIQKLIDLTGMSQELAEYYMSSEIEPNF